MKRKEGLDVPYAKVEDWNKSRTVKEIKGNEECLRSWEMTEQKKSLEQVLEWNKCGGIREKWCEKIEEERS